MHEQKSQVGSGPLMPVPAIWLFVAPLTPDGNLKQYAYGCTLEVSN